MEEWRLAQWLAALLLVACAGSAPLPVVTLTPEGPYEWARGRAVLHRESQQGVRFWAAFERDRGEYLEWWIRVENGSQRTLQVAPEYFFYRIAESERGGQSLRALVPERALAELDAERARADAREADAAGRGLGHHFLESVLDGMLGLEPQSFAEARYARRQQRAAYLTEREAREHWRDVLADRTVRRGALRPGESVQGLVLFPRLAHVGRTELILIVKPAIARFPYQSRR